MTEKERILEICEALIEAEYLQPKEQLAIYRRMLMTIHCILKPEMGKRYFDN